MLNPSRSVLRPAGSYPLNEPSYIILLASIVFLGGCERGVEQASNQRVERPVKTITVIETGVSGHFTLSGRVRAGRRVDLAFREVGGRITELPIAGREGEEVDEGELIARLDPTVLRTTLRQIEGNLKTTEAELERARAEHERLLSLRELDPDIVSEANLLQARTDEARAQGLVESMQARVQDATNRLEFSYLRAPFPAIVARRFVDNFQTVQPNEPIVSLQDISTLEILVDVPTQVMVELRRLGAGTVNALAEFQAAPNLQFPLEVREAATDADSSTQTYTVVLEMPQPDDFEVLPGMVANVLISDGEPAQDGAIVIPAIAVLADADGDSVVWVVDRDTSVVRRRTVAVGRVTGTEGIMILDGLESGDEVVVAGVGQLTEGDPVRVWKD